MSIERFEQFRPRLFGIAYRMLGLPMEAEDIVQDVYMRWHQVEQQHIANPEGWMTTVATRLCIDRLRSAQVSRENYIGPWLPAPLQIEDAEEQVLQVEFLSMAFLHVLEQLTPVERAVYLLRHLFEYDYEAIGEIVERQAENCRQIYSRAKSRLAQNQPRFAAEPERNQRLFDQFVASCQSGDMESLLAILAHDVTIWSDGGGKAAAATRPLHGAETVSQFLLGITRLETADMSWELQPLNGQNGLLVYQDGNVILAVCPHIVEEKIKAFYFIRNPDKLRHLTS